MSAETSSICTKQEPVHVEDENHYKTRNEEYFLAGCKYGPMQEGIKDFLCPHCGGYGTDCSVKCNFCDGTGYIEKNDTRITKVAPEEYVIRLYEEHCEMMRIDDLAKVWMRTPSRSHQALRKGNT
jgi:hypothetical protein